MVTVNNNTKSVLNLVDQGHERGDFMSFPDGGLATVELPTGDHSYEVSAEGYGLASGQVTIIEGDNAELIVELTQQSTANKAAVVFTVVDKESGDPVAEASITLGEQTVQTDASGGAQFETEAGSLRYTVRNASYEDTSGSVEAAEDSTTEEHVKLKKEPAWTPPPESDQPTLRNGDESSDGWVEYLQSLLNKQFGKLVVDYTGAFDGETEEWVIKFQQRENLAVDGIVGNQTWAALRAAPPREPSTDGREPHTHVETGAEARWLSENTDFTIYNNATDVFKLGAVSVGQEPIDDFNATVRVDGLDVLSIKFGAPTAQSPTGDGQDHEVRISNFRETYGPGTHQLEAYMPQELGGDSWSGEIEIPAPDGGGAISGNANGGASQGLASATEVEDADIGSARIRASSNVEAFRNLASAAFLDRIRRQVIRSRAESLIGAGNLDEVHQSLRIAEGEHHDVLLSATLVAAPSRYSYESIRFRVVSADTQPNESGDGQDPPAELPEESDPDARPQLTDPAVVEVQYLRSQCRLVFNIGLTSAAAARYLWPQGNTPGVPQFMPDESDPWRTEDGEYLRFLITPSRAVLTGIRPDVHRQIYNAIPETTIGAELPRWLPSDIRDQIVTRLEQEGNASIYGSWRDNDHPDGVYWVQRRGSTTEVQAIRFGDPDQYDDDRHREAAETVNRDIAHFVREQGMQPRQAKARVRQIHHRILVTLIAGYIDAFTIYGRTSGGANAGGFSHAQLPPE